jgi:hypothetical protein
MTGPRLAEAELLALKSATRVVLLAHGKQSAAAAACRLNEPSLSDCASAYHPERCLPVDVALQLELSGASRAITAALAQAHGCLLVPVVVRGGGDLAAELSALGREVGDVFGASARALADGVVSEAERADLARELAEMIAVGQRALAALSPKLPMRGGK